MPSKMLQFVRLGKAMPEKREAADRSLDFREIYDDFEPASAAAQAGRCSQCGVPFCQVHCPVHNNIPDWLKLTAEGRLEEAYELAAATNNMPEICGRICPQDRLCEGNCVIDKGFESVTIGSVEKFITENAFAEGWVKPPLPRRELGQSVGIIVARRHELLATGGIKFHLNFTVGSDASLEKLRARHDALLVASGVYKAREIACPGVGLRNVVPALDYLVASNRKGLGDAVPAFDSGDLDASGKNVVVIGGGDTAMDCVRTAVRQGAKSVRCLYRRDRANMPGSQREVRHAEEEGVEFVWLAAPEAFLGTDSVSHVRAHRMHLGIADSTGRQVPQPIEGSHFNLEADLAIKALGFDPEDLPVLFGAPELAVTRWGTIKIDHRTMMTALDGVFAAGDIVRGASLVVWGVRDGRDAAEQMHLYLKATADAATA